jgi:hypothetical protein
MGGEAPPRYGSATPLGQDPRPFLAVGPALRLGFRWELHTGPGDASTSHGRRRYRLKVGAARVHVDTRCPWPWQSPR